MGISIKKFLTQCRRLYFFLHSLLLSFLFSLNHNAPKCLSMDNSLCRWPWPIYWHWATYRLQCWPESVYSHVDLSSDSALGKETGCPPKPKAVISYIQCSGNLTSSKYRRSQEIGHKVSEQPKYCPSFHVQKPMPSPRAQVPQSQCCCP